MNDVNVWFDQEIESYLRIEGVRQAYVAMTRPKCLLAVAIPESAWDEANVQLAECGFSTLPQSKDLLS